MLHRIFQNYLYPFKFCNKMSPKLIIQLKKNRAQFLKYLSPIKLLRSGFVIRHSTLTPLNKIQCNQLHLGGTQSVNV